MSEPGSESDPEPVPSPSDVDPDAVASATFPIVRKGFDPAAVDQYLDGVAAELRRMEAEAEAARLEAKRVQRELDDARAELASPEPDTNEAIAVLGDEANRVIQAARQSSQEIIAAAESAAEDIRARARDEARQIAEEARRDAEDFDGRLSGQADEVRERLREEIRRARSELAAETDTARAQTRADADEVLARAREEASGIRAEAEEAVRARRDQAGSLAQERLAEADVLVAARLGEAEAKAAQLLADSEAARDTILAELQSQRERLEDHVRTLQGAQARARADIGAAQTMLAALSAELGEVRLREIEIPPLALDLELPVVAVAVPLETEPGGGDADAEPDAEDADAVVLAEIVDVSEAGGEEEPSLEFEDAAAPEDAEIEALFDRVVAHRFGGDDGTGTQPSAPSGTADTFGTGGPEDDVDWGYADDAAAHPEAAPVVVAPDDGAGHAERDAGDAASTQQRVLDALHRFAVDTGEIPVVVAPAESASGGEAAEDASPEPDDTEEAPAEGPGGEGVALELVPSLTRKVKRALQEVENTALDVDSGGAAGIDVGSIFAEYLVPTVRDAIALGFGGDVGERDLGPEAEVVVRSVCGSWAEELSAGLGSTGRPGAAGVVGSARGSAARVAEDLARTAYETGRRRAERAAGEPA